MITQSIKVNLVPGGIPPRIDVSQYDVGSRTIVINLYNGSATFTPPSGTTAVVQGTKPDMHGFQYTATISGSTVTCDLTQQMSCVAGDVVCEIVLTQGTQVLGTGNFILDVEKSALADDTDISETVLPDIIDAARSSAAKAEAAVEHYPYVGGNGNWYVWDAENEAFVDTEVGATGPQGATGATGNGIASITKTGSAGLVDTYTITYTDGTTSTYTVTNGADGDVPIATTSTAGKVKPDGVTITVAADGTLSAVGIAVGDVSNASISSVGKTVSIKWTDPADLVLSGVTIAAWAGTKVVRKEGSAPNSISDGTVVADVTTRDQYASDALTDVTTGDYGTTYYYKLFPYTTSGAVTSGTSLSVTIMPYIYGAEWDGTSTTAFSRTDGAAEFTNPVPYVDGASAYSSPFDNILPWSGMVVEERAGGTMVAIPKFWYKLTQNGTGIKVQIANSEEEGFSVSPAHMDRGDGAGERDVVYVGRYHCGSSNYKSVTGATPYSNATRGTMRTNLHNLGANLWQMDFATRFTVWLLYIVEFADWNSQAKIGYGCGNGSSAQMGYTDSMPYHTGTMLSSRTSYGASTQYRNIEGLWDNVYDWLDGCYYNESGLNIIKNPSNFSDSTGGTAIGVPVAGYPSALSIEEVSGTFSTFIPSAAAGSDSTYVCDYWDYSASGPCLCAGGNFGQGPNRGLFCVYFAAESGRSGGHGCRLMELP